MSKKNGGNRSKTMLIIDALTEIGANGNLVVVPDGSSPLINTSK